MPTGSALHDRLRSVAGERSYRVLADLTGTNSETVRRYMTGQAPSIEFVTAFCRVFRVNHEWLLTGKGPARARELRRAILSEASVSELLDALARSLEQLTDRVERLERFVHTMETRLRAGGAPSGSIDTLRAGLNMAEAGVGSTRGSGGDESAGGSTDGTQESASEDRAGFTDNIDRNGHGLGSGNRTRSGNGIFNNSHDTSQPIGDVRRDEGQENTESLGGSNGAQGDNGGRGDGRSGGDGGDGAGAGVRVRAVADAVASQRPRPGAG